jgi:hypothetical protein
MENRFNKLFLWLLAYYWLLLYIKATDRAVEVGSPIYFAYILPVCLYFGALFPRVLMAQYDRKMLIVLIYGAVVSLVSILRWDISTIANTAIFVAAIVVIIHYRLRPSYGFLNIIFLLSIPLQLLSFYLGNTIYHVIPGLSEDNSIWWRVSIFPLVPESAFLSSIVLFVNILSKNVPLRKTCIVLSIYFLTFSGVRTAAIPAAFVIGVYYIFIYYRKNGNIDLEKLAAAIIAAGFFFISIVVPDFAYFLPQFDNEFLNVFIFRSSDLESFEAIGSKYRTWTISEHLRFASDNPVFGIGTFDFAEMAIDPPIAGSYGTGSEMFITGQFARVGVISLLIVYFVHLAILEGVMQRENIQFMVGTMLLFSMVSYGSFLVPYNLIFLTSISCLVNRQNEQ